MDSKKIQEALSWLINNGYERNVENFLQKLYSLNKYAITINYSNAPDDWSSMLQRNCRKLQRIDTLYFNLKEEHIFEPFNATDRNNMLQWLKTINDSVWF